MPDTIATAASTVARKRRVLRWVLLVGFVVAAMVVLGRYVFRRLEGEMQRSFDEMRVRSVTELAARVVAFRDTTGRCPLGHMTDGKTLTVLLTHEPPREWPSNAPRIVSPELLADELAMVEGDGVVLPSDPQMATYDFWPAIQYETNGDGFTVGVSLYHPHPQAENRGPYWQKLDLVGSCAPGSGLAQSRTGR